MTVAFIAGTSLRLAKSLLFLEQSRKGLNAEEVREFSQRIGCRTIAVGRLNRPLDHFFDVCTERTGYTDVARTIGGRRIRSYACQAIDNGSVNSRIEQEMIFWVVRVRSQVGLAGIRIVPE